MVFGTQPLELPSSYIVKRWGREGKKMEQLPKAWVSILKVWLTTWMIWGVFPILGDLHICHHPTWENREENVGRRPQRPPRPTLMKSTASARQPSRSQWICDKDLQVLRHAAPPISSNLQGAKRPQKTTSHPRRKSSLGPCRPRPLRRLVPRGAGGEV